MKSLPSTTSNPHGRVRTTSTTARRSTRGCQEDRAFAEALPRTNAVLSENRTEFWRERINHDHGKPLKVKAL
jgi:hypothetical protein